MGLFDTIYVKKKLPLPKEVSKLKIDWKKHDFQTKDLECLMWEYKINSKGQLFISQKETEWVEDNSIFGGYINTISEKWVKSSHTGNVFFYTSVCSNPEQKENSLYEFVSEEKLSAATGYDYSIEFCAQFVDGKLKSLKLHNLEAYSIREHLKRHNEWLTSVLEKEAKLGNRIKSFLRKNIPYRGYNKFINMLNRFINFQQKIVSKLY